MTHDGKSLCICEACRKKHSMIAISAMLHCCYYKVMDEIKEDLSQFRPYVDRMRERLAGRDPLAYGIDAMGSLLDESTAANGKTRYADILGYAAANWELCQEHRQRYEKQTDIQLKRPHELN